MSVPVPFLEAQALSVMGGLAPAQARPVTSEALRAMAARVIQEPGAICAGTGLLFSATTLGLALA